MPGAGFVTQSLETVFNVYNGVDTYGEQRKNGHGVAYSAVRGVGDFALWTVAPELATAQMAFGVASMVGQVAGDLGHGVATSMSKGYRANFGGGYQDTQKSYTMRQRGMSAIQNSFTNARSTLGSEARMYYRGNQYL